jgi:hypothetical protein
MQNLKLIGAMLTDKAIQPINYILKQQYITVTDSRYPKCVLESAKIPLFYS